MSISVLPVLMCFFMAFFFFSSKNFVFSLLSLFMFSFFSCYIVYNMTLEFWGLSLFLIVMTSGLFLVFAYIVSINPQMPMVSMKWELKFILNSLMMVIILSYNLASNLNYTLVVKNNWSVMVTEIDILLKSSFMVSLHLIVLLLFLVVFFMRFTYSKGGGLRKMF